MPRFRLETQYAHELVSDNTYDVVGKQMFRMRCMDGNYESVSTLAPIPFPGGDFGDLAVIYASAQSFGFEIDASRCVATLLELIGGEEHFSFYESPKKDLDQYLPFVSRLELSDDSRSELFSWISKIEINSKSGHELPKYAPESALIRLKGEFGLFPQYDVKTDTGTLHTSVYIHQQTLLDKRHMELATMLLKNNAVSLYNGCDAEYLFDTFTETSDYCIFYSLENELRSIPLYAATVSNNGVSLEEVE